MFNIPSHWQRATSPNLIERCELTGACTTNEFAEQPQYRICDGYYNSDWETEDTQHKHQHGYANHMPNFTIQASLPEPITTPYALHTTHFTHHAPHQPVPLSQQSSYSELSVNLEFMERLECEDQTAASAAHTRQRRPTISTSTPQPAVAVTPSPAASLPNSSSSRKNTRQLLPSSLCTDRTKSVKVSATMTDQGVNIYVEMPPSPDLWKPMNLTFVDESMAQKPSPPADTTVGIICNSKEPKKPSLACTFCRERKIACGRPAEGSIDPTCNQCARRSFTCKYITNDHPRHKRRSRKQ
ncbi:hypothetical protein BJ912DRAFT_1059786 [Pholiota molesta]|nr:hypothetical protein BJ912DRAFT_1059786 [Pholiota molesta]